MNDKYELALVMPVYNEEACIYNVILSWHDALITLGINFIMLVLNDGSTDQTEHELARFIGNKRIKIINKVNAGHGPTILQGYHMAINLADWVFQTDSDDEIPVDYFQELWSRRSDYDALLGCRIKRTQGIARKFITATSRLVVLILFGSKVDDVNSPYRLLRVSILIDALRKIPNGTFAPNILISGILSKSNARIYNHPVLHICRRTGSVSIVKLKLWQGAFKAFYQSIAVALNIKNIK